MRRRKALDDVKTGGFFNILGKLEGKAVFRLDGVWHAGGGTLILALVRQGEGIIAKASE